MDSPNKKFSLLMALSICLDLGCMLKCSNGLQWRLDCGMMDYNSKLVAFGLSIWHYGFALDDCDQTSIITLLHGLC